MKDKFASLVQTIALNRNRTAVQFDQIFDKCQADTQSAVGLCRPMITLNEHLEDAW